MKNKRMSVILIMLAITLALSVFGFSACRDDKGETDGICTVVIATGEAIEDYEVEISKVSVKNGLLSVLEYLQDEKKISFEYSGTNSSAYLTKINGFVSGTDGNHIYIYTSVEKDFDVSGEYKSTVEYKGETLTSTGVGASLMTIEDKAVIYIGTVNFG